jgi:hypothetical protein
MCVLQTDIHGLFASMLLYTLKSVSTSCKCGFARFRHSASAIVVMYHTVEWLNIYNYDSHPDVVHAWEDKPWIHVTIPPTVVNNWLPRDGLFLSYPLKSLQPTSTILHQVVVAHGCADRVVVKNTTVNNCMYLVRDLPTNTFLRWTHRVHKLHKAHKTS